MNSFSKKSEGRLRECEPPLQTLMRRVLQEIDITVLCGHRTEQEQNEAYRLGNSRLKYPNSKHNKIPSQAVDVAPYPVDWNNTQDFEKLGIVVKRIWSEMTEEERGGWKLVWGREFKGLVDYPHWELRR